MERRLRRPRTCTAGDGVSLVTREGVLVRKEEKKKKRRRRRRKGCRWIDAAHLTRRSEGDEEEEAAYWSMALCGAEHSRRLRVAWSRNAQGAVGPAQSIDVGALSLPSRSTAPRDDRCSSSAFVHVHLLFLFSFFGPLLARFQLLQHLLQP